MTAITEPLEPIDALRLLVENRAWESRCDVAWDEADKTIAAYADRTVDDGPSRPWFRLGVYGLYP
jgi:hypothetical protein